MCVFEGGDAGYVTEWADKKTHARGNKATIRILED